MEYLTDDITLDMFELEGREKKCIETIARSHQTYYQDVWRRFKKNKIALVSLTIILLYMFLFTLNSFVGNG